MQMTVARGCYFISRSSMKCEIESVWVPIHTPIAYKHVTVQSIMSQNNEWRFRMNAADENH
eukprot:758811-Hanusia_phi.AAC.3